MKKEFDLTIETDKSVDDAVAAIETESQEAGFRVLHIHDVQATLAAKGFVREPMKIVEICNAKFANAVLSVDPRISLMLPCPISVYAEKGRTTITALRPSAMVDYFPSPEVETIALAVEEQIIKIVESAR
ncbi:MAG: DUF302 domain-containing protein [Candidatus Zixiibacteriota bacterium]